MGFEPTCPCGQTVFKLSGEKSKALIYCVYKQFVIVPLYDFVHTVFESEMAFFKRNCPFFLGTPWGHLMKDV